jgi:small-conductance mechanosensitive channel
MGTVEHIGLKTTRLRSLSGEQLIFSNNDLLKSRVRNYKRMAERRVVFSIGVTYQTPSGKLKHIPDTIRQIIEGLETVRFDRAHFQGYGDYALNFEVVYYVLDADYNRYMDIQQDINLAIYEAFEREGIEFAYPTQTLYIEGSPEQVTDAPHPLAAGEAV